MAFSLKEYMRKAIGRLKYQTSSCFGLVKRRRAQDNPAYRLSLEPPNWQLLIMLVISAVLLGLVFFDQAAGVWQKTVPEVIYRGFRLYTDLGKSEILLIPAALAVLALGFLNWQPLRTAQRAVLIRAQMLGLFVFVAIAGSGLTNNLLKILFGRARPRHFDELGPLAFDAPGLSSGFQSFPSGHSATAGALAIILILLLPRLKWLWFGLTVWIAISRVIVGSHYPSDIVAGFSYGAAFTWLLAAWMARYRLYFRIMDGAIGIPKQLRLSGSSLYKALSLLRQKAYDKASIDKDAGET
ncbi:MAG: phosphatase PAP2 family protein [Cohaesibacter sp.]|nr:phosphatase PAP2 family protein [Cohaesibacter sp.]